MLNGGGKGSNWNNRLMGAQRQRQFGDRRREQQVPTLGPPRLQRAAEMGGGRESQRVVDGGEMRGDLSLHAVYRLEFVCGEGSSDLFFEFSKPDADVGAPERGEMQSERRVGQSLGPHRCDGVAERFEQ